MHPTNHRVRRFFKGKLDSIEIRRLLGRFHVLNQGIIVMPLLAPKESLQKPGDRGCLMQLIACRAGEPLERSLTLPSPSTSSPHQNCE
jgi:hypothetical protein